MIKAQASLFEIETSRNGVSNAMRNFNDAETSINDFIFDVIHLSKMKIAAISNTDSLLATKIAEVSTLISNCDLQIIDIKIRLNSTPETIKKHIVEKDDEGNICSDYYIEESNPEYEKIKTDLYHAEQKLISLKEICTTFKSFKITGCNYINDIKNCIKDIENIKNDIEKNFSNSSVIFDNALRHLTRLCLIVGDYQETILQFDCNDIWHKRNL